MQIYTRVLGCVVAASLGLAAQARPAVPTEDAGNAALQSEVQAMKSEIESMKRDYEARLHALEERVALAESRNASVIAATARGDREGSAAAPTSADANASGNAALPGVSAPADSAIEPQGPVSTLTRLANTLNPSISAILQGRAAYLQGGGGERSIPGFPLGAETDRGPKGLALGESELVFSANVDDKLYGFFDMTFDQGDIGIEEAYISTLALPLGFGLKAGQFLSAIGYQNDRHSHTWDFIDQPLVYDAMLAGGLSDPGIQLTWVAPTDLYVELGAEVFRGDAFPAAGADNDGFGSATAFAKVSGDLGDSSTWLAGLSYLRSESDGRMSELSNGQMASFDGSTDLAIADFVWKWAPLGNFRERNFTFQAEYMHRHDSGRVTSNGSFGHYRSDQDGFYVQGVYQFMPRWRVGLRYGELWSDENANGLPPSLFEADGSSPRRVSAMADFSNSEFSRFRLQYSFDAGGLGDDSLVYLQYIVSIGSHGAHSF